MNLRCACGIPVEAANVNVAAAIASCTTCGAVFSIAQTAPARREPAVIPDGFAPPAGSSEVGATYRALGAAGASRWSYRWFRWLYVPMVVFLVFWDTISFGGVVAGVLRGGAGLFMLLLPHAWIGVGLTYWVLAHLLNRSTIELGRDGLTVTSGPIPWRKVKRTRAEITGFDTTEGFGNRGQSRYKVRVIDREKRATLVIGGLSQEEASYLAGELNEALRRERLPAAA